MWGPCSFMAPKVWGCRTTYSWHLEVLWQACTRRRQCRGVESDFASYTCMHNCYPCVTICITHFARVSSKRHCSTHFRKKVNLIKVTFHSYIIPFKKYKALVISTIIVFSFNQKLTYIYAECIMLVEFITSNLSLQESNEQDVEPLYVLGEFPAKNSFSKKVS